MHGYDGQKTREIQRMIDSGKSSKQIAADLGISRQSLYQTIKAKKLTLPKEKKKWDELDFLSKITPEEQVAYFLWKVKRGKWQIKGKREAFTILHTDLLPLPVLCPILKMPLDYQNKTGKPHEYSPSIDKIIPELGYIPGNVAVISYRANRIKNDASLAELEALVEWLKQKLK